jgi:hypothetical protein
MEFSNEKYKYNFGLRQESNLRPSNALIWHETIINTRQTIVVSGSVVPLTGDRNPTFISFYLPNQIYTCNDIWITK